MTARVALVTGGDRGLGRHVAARLVGLGHRVVLTGRDLDATIAAADEIGAGAMPLDVSDPAEVSRLTRALAAAGTEPDLLVNNAGVDLEESPLQIREDLLSLQMATNLYGPWLLMRAFVRGWSSGATAASSTSAASAVPSGPAGRAAARTASARQRSTP